jgi:hypothetical protein
MIDLMFFVFKWKIVKIWKQSHGNNLNSCMKYAMYGANLEVQKGYNFWWVVGNHA